MTDAEVIAKMLELGTRPDCWEVVLNVIPGARGGKPPQWVAQFLIKDDSRLFNPRASGHGDTAGEAMADLLSKL